MDSASSFQPMPDPYKEAKRLADYERQHECYQCGRRFDSVNPWDCSVPGGRVYGPFCTRKCLDYWAARYDGDEGVLAACHPGCGWNGEVIVADGWWTCPECGKRQPWADHSDGSQRGPA